MITKTDAINLVEPTHIDQMLHPQFKDEALYANDVIGVGLPASPVRVASFPNPASTFAHTELTLLFYNPRARRSARSCSTPKPPRRFTRKARRYGLSKIQSARLFPTPDVVLMYD